MADTATQAADTPVQFPSIPGQTQAHATLPTGADQGGSPGPISPLMQFISTIRAQNAQGDQGAPGPTNEAAAAQPKQYQDPLGVSMLAALHNISAQAAGAVHEPQNHSEDEFVKAAGSIPFGQLKQIIAMRHQWTPQEMAQQAYLRELQKPAEARANPELMRAYAMMGLGQNFLYSPGAISTTNLPGAPVPMMQQGPQPTN